MSDPIDDHPTIQAIQKDALVHRIALLILTIAVLMIAGSAVYLDFVISGFVRMG